MFFKKWREQEKVNIEVDSKLQAMDGSLQTSFNKVKADVQHTNQWINYLHQQQDRMNEQMSTMNSKFDTLITKDEIKYFVDEHYKDIDELKSNVSAMKNELSGYISTIYTNQGAVFQRLDALSRTNEGINREVKQDLQHEMTSFKQEVRDMVHGQIQQIQANSPSQGIFERLDQFNSRLDEMQSSMGSMQEKVNTKQNLKEKIFKKVTRHSKEYVKSMLVSLIKKYDKISGLNLREIVVEEQGIVSKSSFYRLLTEIEEDEGVHVVQEGKEKHYFWMLNQAPEAK